MNASNAPSLYPWQTHSWQQWQQQQARLSHAYLLHSMPGLGIESFALAMAQGLLCPHAQKTQGAQACQQCEACHLFQTQQHPDLFHVTVAEGKNEITIDQIRSLIAKLYETSHQGGYKVAVIEQAEKMNLSAFNALLKSLEEPPERTVLILTTHQLPRLPATILSRCQKLPILPPPRQEAQAWLQQQCPQADCALINKALRYQYGAPLSAKDWIEQGVVKQVNQWQQDCQALQQGQKSVPEVVESWLKWSHPEQAIDYFYHWSVGQTRQALYRQAVPFQPRWMTLQSVLLQAQNLWRQNLNKALLLENITLLWLASLSDDPLFETLASPFLNRPPLQ